ncbi:MAG TPA: hypothetical protein VJ826_04280 [Candidatus Polarisedimenticolaceae bacterium]|nr:hypothetical protein [Candidatus Polarisedimenticolaceae bacterium]
MRNSFVPVAVLSLALAGCAQSPVAEIDGAKQALDRARDAQAPDYAPDAWTAANDAQARLDAELDAQTHKNALFRSYSKSKELASEVKASAERATELAATGKDKAKTEAATLITQARDEYALAQQALTSAPKGKGTEADLASLKGNASGIEGTLAEMQSAFDAGNYLTAKTKAQAAIDASREIVKEIEAAKAQRRAA